MAKKKQSMECAECAEMPVIGMQCDDCIAKAKGFQNIKLITDMARGIADRIENDFIIGRDHQLFIKNVLRDYADRLDRKSAGKSGKGVKKDSVASDQARLRATSNRIQNEFNRLMEIKIPKKSRGRQPGFSPKIK